MTKRSRTYLECPTCHRRSGRIVKSRFEANTGAPDTIERTCVCDDCGTRFHQPFQALKAFVIRRGKAAA